MGVTKEPSKSLSGLVHRLSFLLWKIPNTYWSRRKSIWTHKNPSSNFNSCQHLATIVILRFMPGNSSIWIHCRSISIFCWFCCFLFLSSCYYFIVFQKSYWKIICGNSLMSRIISFCRKDLYFLLLTSGITLIQFRDEDEFRAKLKLLLQEPASFWFTLLGWPRVSYQAQDYNICDSIPMRPPKVLLSILAASSWIGKLPWRKTQTLDIYYPVSSPMCWAEYVYVYVVYVYCVYVCVYVP